MSLDARADIVARIRAALDSADARSPVALAVSTAPVVDRSAQVSDDSLRDIFAAELAAVSGEAVMVTPAGSDALALAVAQHVDRAGYAAIAVHGEPLALSAASKIPPEKLLDLATAALPDLEKADCAIVAAESLLADTGSAVVRLATYDDRLLPYLPPACIIVARASTIVPSLTARSLIGDDAERGERVIITGPSRTGDIEKTVVLGAHGPGSVVVFVAEA